MEGISKQDQGVTPSPSGSQASPEAARASSPSVSIPNAAEARAICQRFALQHRVIFDEEGECGFGRECVGFRDGNWIDHNPDRMKPSAYGHDYEPIAELASDDCYPPDGVRAYHKHDCLAVLGRGDEAVIQLARWVLHMESRGAVEIVTFATGATGVQAMISGVTSRAVVVRPASGIEAATAGETRSGSAEGESPAPAGGDAQPLDPKGQQP